MSPRTVITFGTFDVLHVGHIRVLQRASELGDRLVVGVSADALNIAKKGRAPVFSQEERLEIVGSLKMVDEVFVEESLEKKRDYIVEHGADVNARSDDGRTPLILAAGHAGSTPIVKLLLERGANPNPNGGTGRDTTPLREAATRPSTIGRSNSRYCGLNSSMIAPVLSTR